MQFVGTILIRLNIYTVIFKFNLIISRVGVRLALGLRVRVFVDVYLYGISHYYYYIAYSPIVFK